MPTQKLIAPGPIVLDHYHCYDATGPSLNISITLQDQFQPQTATVLDPFLFCTPADKNGEGIQNPVDHLTCYNYLPPGAPPAFPVPIANQFFASTQLDVAEPFALCVPSTKPLPPEGLDHFSVYDAQGPEGPVVQLADQFGTQVTDLGILRRFLVPADKNGEGIIDLFSHLSCYEIVDGDPAPPVVFATNQFGEQRLNLGLPQDLCVPTEKLLTPGPVKIDHFKCYEASGNPLLVSLDYADQFQGVVTTLVDPFLFCNPVDKNGEGIQNPDDHLACFLTQPPGGVLGALVPILNQFLAAPANINLSEPFAFCLPSTKRLPPGVPALPPWGLVAIAGVTLGAAWALGVRWRARRRT